MTTPHGVSLIWDMQGGYVLSVLSNMGLFRTPAVPELVGVRIHALIS